MNNVYVYQTISIEIKVKVCTPSQLTMAETVYLTDSKHEEIKIFF